MRRVETRSTENPRPPLRTPNWTESLWLLLLVKACCAFWWLLSQRATKLTARGGHICKCKSCNFWTNICKFQPFRSNHFASSVDFFQEGQANWLPEAAMFASTNLLFLDENLQIPAIVRRVETRSTENPRPPLRTPNWTESLWLRFLVKARCLFSWLLAGTRDTVPEQRLTLFCQFFTLINSG